MGKLEKSSIFIFMGEVGEESRTTTRLRATGTATSELWLDESRSPPTASRAETWMGGELPFLFNSTQAICLTQKRQRMEEAEKANDLLLQQGWKIIIIIKEVMYFKVSWGFWDF
jgi:hypothetical protein